MKFTVNCTSSSTAFIFYNAPGTLSLVVRGNLVPWVSTEMESYHNIKVEIQFYFALNIL